MSSGPNGDGIVFDTGTPQNGAANRFHSWINPVLILWQDTSSFGKLVAQIGNNNAWSSSGVDTDLHTVLFNYVNGDASVSVDGGSLSNQVASGRPTSIWFGNPSQSVASPWSSFNIDQIQVTYSDWRRALEFEFIGANYNVSPHWLQNLVPCRYCVPHLEYIIMEAKINWRLYVKSGGAFLLVLDELLLTWHYLNCWLFRTSREEKYSRWNKGENCFKRLGWIRPLSLPSDVISSSFDCCSYLLRTRSSL